MKKIETQLNSKNMSMIEFYRNRDIPFRNKNGAIIKYESEKDRISALEDLARNKFQIEEHIFSDGKKIYYVIYRCNKEKCGGPYPSLNYAEKHIDTLVNTKLVQINIIDYEAKLPTNPHDNLPMYDKSKLVYVDKKVEIKSYD